MSNATGMPVCVSKEVLREADDPRATRIPNGGVEAEWRLRRAEPLIRADGAAA